MDTFWVGRKSFNKIKPKPLLLWLQTALETVQCTPYFVFYFQKKLVGSNKGLDCGKRMFIVEAAASWEARSYLEHNLGAKSLVAVLQLHLRARVDWASDWPCGRLSLPHHSGAVRLQEGKIKPWPKTPSVGEGRRIYDDAAPPPLTLSGNPGCWPAPVTRRFYFHPTASSTCMILK